LFIFSNISKGACLVANYHYEYIRRVYGNYGKKQGAVLLTHENYVTVNYSGAKIEYVQDS
jgi:hypothetical protein